MIESSKVAKILEAHKSSNLQGLGGRASLVASILSQEIPGTEQPDTTQKILKLLDHFENSSLGSRRTRDQIMSDLRLEKVID